MSTWDRIQALPLWLLAPMAAAFGVILWRGWLRPDALRDAPSRKIGFSPTDLLVAAGLMLTGMSLGSLVVARFVDAPLTTFMGAAIAAQLLGSGLPVLYLGVRAATQDRGLRRIGYVPTRPVRDVSVGVVASVLAPAIVFGVMVLGAIVGALFGYDAPQLAHTLLTRLRDDGTTSGAAMVVLSAVVVAPILEEALYRGLWQSMIVEGLGERLRWPAVMIAATIFMAVHIGAVDVQALPALWALGVMLGWLYERTGSLLPGILVHMAFNAINIGFVLLFVEPAAPPPVT